MSQLWLSLDSVLNQCDAVLTQFWLRLVSALFQFKLVLIMPQFCINFNSFLAQFCLSFYFSLTQFVWLNRKTFLTFPDVVFLCVMRNVKMVISILRTNAPSLPRPLTSKVKTIASERCQKLRICMQLALFILASLPWGFYSGNKGHKMTKRNK